MNRRPKRKRYPKGTWMLLTSATTLRALMGQRELGYSRLAERCGQRPDGRPRCSRGFLSHLATGRRNSCSPDLAQRIAEQLEVPLELLFVPKMASDSSQNGNRRAA